MSEDTLLAFEQPQSRTEIATLLRSLTDQLDGDGAVTLTVGEQTITVTPPARPTFELEVERERQDDDPSELSIEIEIEWEESADDGATEPTTVATTDEKDAPSSAVAGTVESRGQFQLYKDRRGEWRWRLVHRNGNIIATGGEGYSSRRNAEKGMRSVMKNAPGAEVISVE